MVANPAIMTGPLTFCRVDLVESMRGGRVPPTARYPQAYHNGRDGDHDSAGVKQVRFDLEQNTVATTYHRDDYNRSEPEDEELQHKVRALRPW